MNALRPKKPVWWLWRGALVCLTIWISLDVLVPSKHSIRQFDPAEVARRETVMWRSYYDKNPVLLFWQLAGGLRQQFHVSFWRSFGLALQATKAAFVFKQGQSRADYQKALPILIDYYQSIQALTTDPFDVPKLARSELEWWIVHRQRDQYSYGDLAGALARTAAVQYNQSPGQFVLYAQLRANAMKLCDNAGQSPKGATEADWQRIERVLNQAWKNLHDVVQRKTKDPYVRSNRQ